MKVCSVVLVAVLLVTILSVCTSAEAKAAPELIDESGAGRYFYKVYLSADPEGNLHYIWDIGSSGYKTLTGITEEKETPMYLLFGFRNAVTQIERSIVSLVLLSVYVLLTLLVAGLYVRKRYPLSGSYLLPFILMVFVIMAPLVVRSITGLINALSDAEYYFQYIWTLVEG